MFPLDCRAITAPVTVNMSRATACVYRDARTYGPTVFAAFEQTPPQLFPDLAEELR